MPDDATLNLFDQSSFSKKQKLRPIPSKKDKRVAKGSSHPQSAPPKHVKLDPEVETMLTAMKDMHKDIDNKLRKIYELSGLKRDQIASYINDPRNFTAQEWEILQARRDQVENKLLSFLGPKVQAEREKAKNQGLSKAQASEQAKNRKSKTLAARKKNWIPVR